MVNDSTQFWNPPNKNGSLSDLKIGDRVAVLAERANSVLTAKRVLIIRAKPVHEHLRGVVTAISGDTVTFTYDGKTITADLPPGLVKRLKVGDTVTIVISTKPGADKVQMKDMRSDNELMERLKDIAGKRPDRAYEINELIARGKGKQVEMLERIKGMAPGAALPGIEAAIEQAKDRGNGNNGRGPGTGQGNGGGPANNQGPNGQSGSGRGNGNGGSGGRGRSGK